MTLILSFIFVVALCSAGNITLKKGDISVKTVQDYEKATGDEKRQLETQIIENIFVNSGKTDDIPVAGTSELSITYGDVVGDNQDDIVFVVRIGPRTTMASVYERVDDRYIYKDTLGDFFVIQQIQIVSVDNKEKDIIMIREHVNQMIGAYEESVFLRAYRWNELKNKFELVLTIQENYRAYWNELWDNEKPAEESHWLSVKQNGKTTRGNSENYSKLYFRAKQLYQQSKQTNSIEMPKDEDFTTTTQRDISKVYYWSDKWKHFILNEGTEIQSGKRVAILEDMSQEASSLVESDERYRIKREDGTIEFVDKQGIKPDSQ